MLRFHPAFVLCFTLFSFNAVACGFGFVGDCSTIISLKINGTQDSFFVANCPSPTGLKFDGFEFGSLKSLSVVRAKSITWESCQNNVSNVRLYFRVYEKGFPGGSWQNFSLQEDYNTLAGPYTTRYRSGNTNANVTDNLIAGKTYVLEVYFLAEVDTIGDDFIPETTLLQDNNGQNYHLTFQYGGPSAPPFVTHPTKIIDVKCHGDSTGTAGITVYGNPSGLFYQWSTGGNNYPILTKIPAGMYWVTVTEAGGYAEVDSIKISEPEALSAQFTATGLGCNGSPGMATVIPSGGVKPYYYKWENGSETPATTFPASGDYRVTVRDANNCKSTFSVSIPAEPIVETSLAAAICAGDTFSFAGMLFSDPGVYEVNLPGAGSDCDTLAQLTLDVHVPPTVELTYVVEPPFRCQSDDPLHLALVVNTNAEQPVYSWLYNGNIISTTDTCRYIFSAAVNPSIALLTVADKYGCRAQAGGFNAVFGDPLPIQILASALDPVADLKNGAITLGMQDGIEPYTVEWDNGATGPSIGNLGPGTYCATVTDAHGCTASTCITLKTSGVAGLFSVPSVKISPNPVAAGSRVNIVLPENFSTTEWLLEILDLQGRTLLRQSTPCSQGVAGIELPQNLPAGMAIVRMTDGDGKTAIGRLSVF